MWWRGLFYFKWTKTPNFLHSVTHEKNAKFLLNVVVTKRLYCYHGITASHLPSPSYCREIFPIPAVITADPRGNYRGYRGITAFPVTVSCSSVDRPFQSTCDQAEQWWQRWAMRWDVVVLAGCQASPRRCKLQHQTVPSRSKTTTTGQPELRQSPPADTVGCQPPYLRHAH